MGKVIKADPADVKADVARSLQFSKSGLDVVEEEEVVIKEDAVEEEVIEEEDDTSIDEPDDEEDDEEEPDEDKEDAIDYESLWKSEREDKQKLLDKLGDKGDSEDKPAPPADVAFMDGSKVSDEDFENITSSKESFVEAMNELGNNVRTTTMNEILGEIPKIVTSIASFQINLSELNRRFYEENEDLVGVKKYVGTLADEMIKDAGINDLDSYEKMLKELPKLVRTQLKMKKKTAKKKMGKNPKPDGQRVRGESDDDGLSPLQKDIKKALNFSKQRRA